MVHFVASMEKTIPLVLWFVLDHKYVITPVVSIKLLFLPLFIIFHKYLEYLIKWNPWKIMYLNSSGKIYKKFYIKNSYKKFCCFPPIFPQAQGVLEKCDILWKHKAQPGPRNLSETSRSQQLSRYLRLRKKHNANRSTQKNEHLHLWCFDVTPINSFKTEADII